MSDIYELGKMGETIAADYLKDQGYCIIRRNFRYLKAEIDIIARKKDILAMVEVKTRSEDFYEEISEAITKKKRNLMVLAADHYVLINELEIEVRFDIITVIKGRKGLTVDHLPDAFYHF